MMKIENRLQKWKYFSYGLSLFFLIHVVALASRITMIQNLAVFMLFFSGQILVLDRMIKADKEIDEEGIL